MVANNKWPKLYPHIIHSMDYFTSHIDPYLFIQHDENFADYFIGLCDWPLNLSRDHFGLHQEKNVRVIMKLEVLKSPIVSPTLSIVTVQWSGRGKRGKTLFIYVYAKCFHSYEGRKEEGQT